MDYDFTPYLERIERAVRDALPEAPGGQWQQAYFGELPPGVTQGHVAPLVAPCRELVLLGGKRWRPLLLALCAQAWLTRGTDCGYEGIAEDPRMALAFSMTPLVELVHTASLMHDDIEDRSDTRRGKPAAYLTYGTDVALNAGAWLYFAAATCVKAADCDDATRLRLYDAYAQELRRLHLGQAMDIAWHNGGIAAAPGTEQYLAMVRCKTGTLASLAVRVGLLCAGADDQAVQTAARAASGIGAGFQVLDDVTNLTTGNAGKKRGDDIVEGKLSLPVLLFLQGCRERGDADGSKRLGQLFATARRDGIDSPAVEQAIGLLSGSGVVAQAQQTGSQLVSGSCGQLCGLFGAQNPAALRIGQMFDTMVKKSLGNT